MSTTKMGSGLAFTPQKDLEMFATMAAQGKQLTGFGALGHGWTFTDAAPEEAIFDLAYDDDPSDDYFDIFAAAGWAHVLSGGNLHIFKAKPGTPAVHTAAESRRDELLSQRNRYLGYSAIALVFLLLAGALVRAVHWNDWVEIVILMVAIIPAVYTVMPLVGYTAQLRTVR